jgi:hypothetical protein
MYVKRNLIGQMWSISPAFATVNEIFPDSDASKVLI